MQEEKNILILKFLSNEATEEESKELRDWISDKEENKRCFADFEKIFNAAQILNNRDRFNALEAYHNFNQETRKSRRSFLIKVLPIAATLVLVFALSFFYFYNFRGNITNDAKLTVIEAPSGSKSVVNLPDGTKITLNANSRLEYSSAFNVQDREVFLEGEGYFDIKKDKKHSFIVRTSDIEIKVFGTVFNVKSYPDEQTVETTLLEGSIAIHGTRSVGNKKIVELKPNQSVTFYKASGEFFLKDETKTEKRSENVLLQQKAKKRIENIVLTENVDTDVYISWKDNIVIFNNERFETLAKRLERQYGAKINFTDESLKDYRFTGTFNEISIVQALNYLQFASYFNYRIEEEKVYISK